MATFGDFDEWYTRTRPVVVSAVSAMGAPHDLAVDAADEAFTRAAERWESVSVMTNRDGWAYVVARRVAVGQLRRRQVARRKFHVLKDSSPIEHHDPPPETHELRKLLEPLTEAQREAVVLRNYFGMTEPEIAEAIGASRGTVSSRLRSAYKVLRDATVMMMLLAMGER
ncbi:MAG: sigma-70 family RNA polymerase sigma factor [Actinomycetota bacterium]